MKKPETKFKERVRKDPNKLPHTWHFKADMVSIIGIPDIIGCMNGWLFAYELKVGDNKISLVQEYTLKKIRKAGGRAQVLTPEQWPFEYKILKESAQHGIFP